MRQPRVLDSKKLGEANKCAKKLRSCNTAKWDRLAVHIDYYLSLQNKERKSLRRCKIHGL